MNRQDNIITDKELHELFKMRLLEQEPDALTQKLMDMEMITAFSAEPLIVPGLQKEKEMLGKLGSKTGFMGPGFKWLFTGMSVAVITTVAILYKGSQMPTEPHRPVQHVLPVNKPAIDTPQKPLQHFTIPTMSPSPEKHETIAEQPLRPAPEPPQQTPPAIDTAVAQAPEAPPEKDATSYYGGPAPSGTHNAPNPKPRGGRNEDTSGRVAVDTLLKGVKRLEINGAFCDVTITSHAEDHIKMTGEMKYEFKGMIVRKPQYRVSYERKDTALIVTVHNTKKAPMVFAGSMNYSGYLNLQVPAQTSIIIKNSSGNITASNLSGPVCELTTPYGHIKAERLHTHLTVKSSSGNATLNLIEGQVSCRLSYGHIQAEDIHGNLKLTSSSGNIQLEDVEGDADISSSYGNTVLDDIAGEVRVSSSSGSVRGNNITGKKVAITSSYGNISLSAITASVTIRSSSGKVELKTIKGPVSVSSSYGDQALSHITGDVILHSSSGNIRLDDQSGALSIHSVYGDVEANDCRGSVDIKTQSGDIHGKNIEVVKTIDLNASYGDIKMNLKNKMEDLSFNLQSGSGTIRLNKDGVKMESNEGKLQIRRGSISVTGITASGSQYFD